MCTETCPEGTADVNNDNICTEGEHCGANEYYDSEYEVCTCIDTAALADDDRCVIPSPNTDCERRMEIDGVMKCIGVNICINGMKLADDGLGYTCVETCESGKFEEDEKTKELRCVKDCKAWYWTVKDGRCTEEKWRLNTAIAVPIVVVILAAGVAVAYFVWKKSKGGRRKIEKIDEKEIEKTDSA